ncbi:hypothetical protein H4R34_006124 [Dimargaris verticillata]|uniref:Uncharacterized protein n=1 Tax=Dimargaris verticillata TaxID=2761393 RepID=A0A9W8AX68_9FUNG|nr:hypothetical protein H4R34_006124 [Dimargaris verticillata]
MPRALFWTWAIELGYDEVRKVLKPTYENWTTEDYNRLTTIMCQLNVSKVCDYLKTLDYTPGAPIAFNQMTIAQRLQELPNPYMNWDPENPRQVWVAKPEDQQMAEPLQVDSPIDV